MSKEITLKPRISEKTYALGGDEGRTYVFEIPKNVNKHTIAKAVSNQYSVGVVRVRISALPSKSRRSNRRGGRIVQGQSTAIRKAYVTLKEGDKLPIFTAIEEAEKSTKETK